MTVIQFPRDFIYSEGCFKYLLYDPDVPTSAAINPVWISLREKGAAQDPSFLDQLPNLKIEFDDVPEPLEYDGKVLMPPTQEEADKIVEFIGLHWGKEMFINCAAGRSRSGAVAAYLEERGYYWPNSFKFRANPNQLLLKLLRNSSKISPK